MDVKPESPNIPLSLAVELGKSAAAILRLRTRPPDLVSISTTAGGLQARQALPQRPQPGGTPAGRIPLRGHRGGGASGPRKRRGGAHSGAALGEGLAG